jgi:hypothetical protein
MELIKAALNVLLVVLALAACTSQDIEPEEQETPLEPGQPQTPETGTPQGTPRPAEPTATDEPEPDAATRPRVDVEVTPVEELEPLPTLPVPQTPVTGEAPSGLVQEMKADLSARTGIPVEEIAVDYAAAVVWPDGSMGCPQPGMMYTMALVPGYRVIFVAGGNQYDYHASERGGFILCEGSSSKPGLGPVGTPSW